ncbi:hypothetical protein ACBJ59_45510 [Nonomuraea sp. MTCD27]|uniref:hypothetical protein n=1 Tax=Nonomuraea sp. MTCD27 TaxID=1676747 RepID=UPI0035C1C08D
MYDRPASAATTRLARRPYRELTGTPACGVTCATRPSRHETPTATSPAHAPDGQRLRQVTGGAAATAGNAISGAFSRRGGG